MRLQDLLYNVNILKIVGFTNIEILDVQFDSRKTNKKGMFIAIRGMVSDGHEHISSSIKNGAIAIVVEQLPTLVNDEITYVQVADSSHALGVIAANFYGNPSEKINLVGVTGTNGKTTIVNLLHQLFSLLNKKSGMLSTIENKILDKVIPSTHTTPDPLQINYLLYEMIQKGCRYCFMEVSSHSLKQGRVNGLQFSGGVFTNITHEHLDYHKTFSEYRDVKKSFFDLLDKDAFALVNKDDKNGDKMLEGTKASKLYYALKSFSDYRCKIIENQFEGMLLQINKIDVWVKIIGGFNAYNILAVYGVAKQFGLKDHDVLLALSMLKPVEGRFQVIRNESNITGIVDYAHTDDALNKILLTINDIRINKQSLITIVGCGGERDITKRPLMAQVACDLSTHVIITSDNPRSEDPDKIIEDMLSGLDQDQKNKVLVITDRRQAIMTSAKLAKAYDIILVAGKGHEKYQEIKGNKLPFNDVEELKKSLNIILR